MIISCSIASATNSVNVKRPENQQFGGGVGFGQGAGLYHGVAHMEEAEGGAQWKEVGSWGSG